jgi:hypothetical protein
MIQRKHLGNKEARDKVNNDENQYLQTKNNPFLGDGFHTLFKNLALRFRGIGIPTILKALGFALIAVVGEIAMSSEPGLALVVLGVVLFYLWKSDR